MRSELEQMKGLRVERYYTMEDVNVYDTVEYDKRSSVIRNPDGSVVFELTDVEVPKSWSQVATDILAQKYFRKAGVPLRDKDGEPLLDEDGKQITGGETSVKQVVRRLAGCWRFWGETYGYFATSKDAQIYEEEMVYMLLHQVGAPNSPQWFNTGLNWAYGLTNPPQGHYFVNPKTGELEKSKDAYTRPQPHACFIQKVRDDLVNEGGIFDLATREARLFKYGSGTGTNFSQLRGLGERLSGGGKSSGLSSWLKIFDRAAGAVKSGGTTRRAAKMVCLDMDHPEIEWFIDWKMLEEQKVAALVAGSKACEARLNAIMRAAKDNQDIKSNPELGRAIKAAFADHVPPNYIFRALQLVRQGETSINFKTFDTHYESDAYQTVSGQNANNSVRITNDFMKAVEDDSEWDLVARTTGEVMKKVQARHLWDKICYAAWACADPGVQFDTTINEWHTCPEDGRINASNPCSEYMFLDDTACNLASLNLVKFLDKSNTFDVKGYLHAVRLWTVTLEVSVLMAQFPSKSIAELSYIFRTLGLGYANIGSMLMRMGIPYDSDEGRAICGAVTALMHGKAYTTSAEMASVLGPFANFKKNKDHMLRVIRNHRRAAYNAAASEYEGLTVTPLGIDAGLCPSYLLRSAQQVWDEALEKGREFGYRNAQVTVLAPTGTIGLIMDCDTTGIEPDFALVKFKKLAGGGYFKIVNQSVPIALRTLGYSQEEIDGIVNYCVGHGTLKGCPHINPGVLVEKGFDTRAIQAVEDQLQSAFDLKFVFNQYTLGDALLTKLGFLKEEYSNPSFNLLGKLGFSEKQIQEANFHVCGTMTVEGAPGLKDEHLPVFDCANKCGSIGKRFIPYMAHIKIMAAAQPFLSGAISKTINMASDADITDISYAYQQSWKLMLKAVALYRDGSKLSQPLNTISSEDDYLNALLDQDNDTLDVQDVQQVAATSFAGKRELPSERHGIVEEVAIGGHDLVLRTGEYKDGTLGEIKVDMYKRGSSYGELMHAFSQAVSLGLQHGVPLKEFTDEFTFTKFEPAGVVSGHPLIKNATSPVDFIFRALAAKYDGRNDLVHIKPPANGEKKDIQTPASSVKTADSGMSKAQEAKKKGYTGESCSTCGSMRLRRNGTCAVCEDCGNTTGCS